MISDIRNEIYIHVDKLSDIYQFGNSTAKYTPMVWTELVYVRWGIISLIE